MDNTRKFINRTAVRFPNANCILMAKVAEGCDVFVPAHISEENQQEAKEQLQQVIDQDQATNTPPPSSGDDFLPTA